MLVVALWGMANGNASENRLLFDSAKQSGGKSALQSISKGNDELFGRARRLFWAINLKTTIRKERAGIEMTKR